VPRAVETALMAVSVNLQHVTLLHVVGAVALAFLVRRLLQRYTLFLSLTAAHSGVCMSSQEHARCRSVPRVELVFEDEAEERDVFDNGRPKLDSRKVR